MLSLKGKNIKLRALEPDDLGFLYELENNPDVWEISGTTTPYSKHVLKQYLDNAHRDIYDVKQLRLCICGVNENVIGLIDLFDFDPHHHRAGVGVLIAHQDDRGKGYAKEALETLKEYCFEVLGLHQLWCNISASNQASLQRLFAAPVAFTWC